MNPSTKHKYEIILDQKSNEWLLEIDLHQQHKLNEVGVAMLKQAINSTPTWFEGSEFWQITSDLDEPVFYKEPEQYLGKSLIQLLSTNKNTLEAVGFILADHRCWQRI